MSTTYEFELEFDPVPSPYEGHQLIYELKESGIKLVRLNGAVFQGFIDLGGEFIGPEEFHRKLQIEISRYKITSRWLDRSNIPWTHVFGPKAPEPSSHVRKVSTEEYEKIYEERYEALDALPGGAQGAHPDMSDLEVELNDDD